MSKNISPLGLGHIGIYISDVEASCAFYKKLGFEVYAQFHRPNGVVLTFVKAGSCVLELIRPVNEALLGRPAGIVDHVCIEVADIEQAAQALKAEGIIDPQTAPGTMPDVFGGAKNLFFQGPDGERLELFELPKA